MIPTSSDTNYKREGAPLRCFVTGASGFVGGHLCERLIADGHEVRALVRATSNTALLEKAGAKIVEGTLDAVNLFARYAEDTDVFFHLAAITRTYRHRTFFDVNTRGTKALVGGLERADYGGKLVLLSSLAAGGPAVNRRAPRTEEHDDDPVSEYGRSKLAAERVVRENAPPACDWTILRPGAIYGPREHQIYDLLKMLQSTGLAFRFGKGVNVQMTHVDDVVEALLLAGTRESANGRTYYVTDPTSWSFDEIMKLAAEVLGKNLRTIPLPMFVATCLATAIDGASRVAGKPLTPLGRDKLAEMKAFNWICDPERIQRELGWKPKWNLTDGMKQTIEWYQAEGWLPSRKS